MFGVSIAQQLCSKLSALASAKAAVRRGEPSVAKRALFGPSLAAGRSQLVPEHCLLSPTGNTAAIVRRGKWDSCSLVLARESAKAGQWFKSSPKDTLPAPGRAGYGQEAFSTSGRWLGSVHVFLPESGRQAAVALLYNTVSGRWLPEQLLREGATTVTYTPVSFSTCETMAAGTLPSSGDDGNLACCLRHQAALCSLRSPPDPHTRVALDPRLHIHASVQQRLVGAL